ncbi:hypothetical protein EYV94_16185 [Puteibacter caeruleilacunae]|nr:hypothetical protein EYV94_16185 [Puteibacter caeruleilacunae]
MKKYDPYMHTAEHVLNQTMVRKFNCERSFSNHLERKKSKCDYLFERALTEQEEREVESEVNKWLAMNLEVCEEVISIEEAQNNFNLTKLPEDAGSEIRIVKVGDYDACPCIGDHVGNTSEVGEFRLMSSSFEDGILRIRFKLRKPA